MSVESGPKNRDLQRGEHEVWNQVWDRVFLLGLLAAIAFVLWLPVFPTGDGPVHLYYADVLWSLVRHQPAYAQDYAIRHLFAPYLVHYLALVSFEHVVAPPMAEKLFIAIIFLSQAFGFRFLARRLGAGGANSGASIACLWMLPLLFSWSLGGGFLNCCFATGVALWSFGLWVLLGEPPVDSAGGMGRRRAGRLLAFAATLAVLVLSHPVPLLVLLLFTASDLFLKSLARVNAWQALAPQAVALTMTCAAFIAPVVLAQKGQAAAVLPGVGFHADVLRELVLGMRLGLFAGLGVHTVAGWLAIVARVGLLAIIPGVALLLFSKRKLAIRSMSSGPQDAQAAWPLTLFMDQSQRLLLSPSACGTLSGCWCWLAALRPLPPVARACGWQAADSSSSRSPRSPDFPRWHALHEPSSSLPPHACPTASEACSSSPTRLSTVMAPRRLTRSMPGAGRALLPRATPFC